MIFGKNVEQACVYCVFAKDINDENFMLCKKKGVVESSYKCRKFVYDPLKREPPKRIVMPTYNEEEFKL